ncbi:OmpA family protein [Falsirhodobacter algicola]|uniref:OmpA family protein n=1 Tax=Falsirhodobacter algicola TaxID=2692330 RepID=A0A8J8MSN3_9RHOB|nr:OmpA family protein [Falsirhodobacter algicola]QUS35558.1 OmpA family protein [Falsirhodobacter algicola]
MRAQAKQVRHEEEEESAFVSMTDMTVGFLFIMMILLAFFASQMRDLESVSKRDYDAAITQRDVFEQQSIEWQTIAERRANRILEIEALLARLRQERDDLEGEVKDLQVQRAQLEANLAAAEQEIKSLKQRIEELDEQLAELQKVDPLEAYLAQVAQVRRQVLVRLRDAIRADFPDLQVELSAESDALRFQGEGLFDSGRSNLTSDKAQIVSRLAERLDEVLPCFTLGEASQFNTECNPGFVMIEAVQIEGHTDNVGSDQLNRNLSAARANSTFFAMTGAAEGIMQHLNLKRQPVLSVAAYGPDRPVTQNDTPEGRSTNRRIDLRFIMVTPQDTDGIEVIRHALETVGGEP